MTVVNLESLYVLFVAAGGNRHDSKSDTYLFAILDGVKHGYARTFIEWNTSESPFYDFISVLVIFEYPKHYDLIFKAAN